MRVPSGEITKNIKAEADFYFNQSTNFDNFRNIYSLPIIIINNEGYIEINDIVYFDTNVIDLERYRFFLLNGSDYIFLESKYKMRPDYLSYDAYGTVALSHLIMYINNITSVMEFTVPYLYLPKEETINEFIMMYETNYGLSKEIKTIKYL